MKKLQILLLSFLAIFMFLSTGCASHGTYSDYRSNWNKNVKQFIENKRTTLPANILSIPENEEGRKLFNAIKNI